MTDNPNNNVSPWQTFLQKLAPQSPSLSSRNNTSHSAHNDVFAPPLPRLKEASSNPQSQSRVMNLSHAHSGLSFRRKGKDRQQQHIEEELSVSNLRRLYSSLLEEIAPLHHEMGTGNANTTTSSVNGKKNSNINTNWRWKNQGTITVNGSDDEGYDYAYTPDNSQKSWRLQRNIPGVSAGGGGGISGGDWSTDGVRRYYTGGAIASRGGGGGRSAAGNIISVGSLDVDVSMIDGVELSPVKGENKSEDMVGVGRRSLDLNEELLQPKFESTEEDAKRAGADATNHEGEDAMEDVDIGASSDMEDVALESAPVKSIEIPTDTQSQSAATHDSLFSSSTDTTNMTAFETLYHLSPTMAWRLRSAYAPTTPQEAHLLSLGSEVFHRHAQKADGMMKGLDVAKCCEARVCEGLRKVGEVLSICEKMRSKRMVVTHGRKFIGSERVSSTQVHDAELSSDDDEDELDAAEAVFAYFCEKNVLPMLIDALLCRPPPLTSSSESQASSPTSFSGATWTASVKSQILQMVAMLLYNTTSPLSLTYLLSNNYMNELIMGVLPLSQWKEETLEEILPPYVSLLRGLVMKLRGEEGRFCVPLFLCQRQRMTLANHDDDSDETEAYMPLLYGAVQVLVSNLGSSVRDSDGCLIRTTAMNVLLNLCRIADPDVRSILVGGGDGGDELPTTKSQASSATNLSPYTTVPSSFTIEQQLLFPHISKNLNSCYHRCVKLLIASLSLNTKHSTHQSQTPQYEIAAAREEATSRHKDIAAALHSELRFWLGFVDDLLSTEIRSWNVKLCESLMSEVVVGTVLLHWNCSLDTLANNTDRAATKLDVYKATAEVRTSVFFITQFFGMVEYVSCHCYQLQYFQELNVLMLIQTVYTCFPLASFDPHGRSSSFA